MVTHFAHIHYKMDKYTELNVFQELVQNCILKVS